MRINWNGYECEVRFSYYQNNGNTAIQLFGAPGTDCAGELVTVASVNGDIQVDPDVVGIKTWSENAGMVQALVDGGVIKPDLLFTRPSGFVRIEYYRLTDEALEKMARQEVGEQ